MTSYFALGRLSGEEVLLPKAGALSFWGSDTLRGPAITVGLARALEDAIPAEGNLQLARITFDLHSPVPLQPLTTSVEILRRGQRLLLADAELVAGDAVRARARALFLSSEEREVLEWGSIWEVDQLPEPPKPGLAEQTPEGRLYGSVGQSWTQERAPHETAAHKSIWFTSVSLVENEDLTPMQLVSAAGDTSNIVSNWGSSGLSYINADVTISLARLPMDGEVGVASSIRAEHCGLAVGSALLFDRKGILGISSVTALPGKRQLTFR